MRINVVKVKVKTRTYLGTPWHSLQWLWPMVDHWRMVYTCCSRAQ